MQYEYLKKLAQEFRLANDTELANKFLLVISAVTGSENPKSDLSYSFIMRGLRRNKSDKLSQFMKEYKKAFDEAYIEEIEDLEEAALMQAMQKIDLKEEDYS